MRRVLLLAIAFSASGCFPDYSSDGAAETPLEPGMLRVRSRDKTFEFSVGNYAYGEPPTIEPPVAASVQFSHDFDMDQHEVTVGRYRDWVDNGYPLPCADDQVPCGVDSEGPYDDGMTWQPEWNPDVTLEYYGPGDCGVVAEGEYGTPPTTTYEIGDDELPMTCVSWTQAVAFCAYEGKRLPTESEWLFVASSNGTKYPWGDSWSGCEEATITYPNCPFPVPVGTAYGQSAEGVEDLGGSVVEWVWDAKWENPIQDWPKGAVDYTGPTFGTALSQEHLRNGGFYWDAQESEQLKNTSFESGFTADQRFKDHGFRCVRTVPHG